MRAFIYIVFSCAVCFLSAGQYDHILQNSKGKKGSSKTKTQVTKPPLKQKPLVVSTPTKAKKIVLLDPGHGGFDFGATSHGCYEKDLTLQTAFFLKQLLIEKGVKVYLTRTKDQFISLEKRVEIAAKLKPHFFISIHYNAAKSPSASGIEVFYPANGDSFRVDQSKKLALGVLQKMIGATGSHSRGTKGANFHVIKETKVPAILIEGGFITHPKERSLLLDQEYIRTIAQSICDAIVLYCEIDKK